MKTFNLFKTILLAVVMMVGSMSVWGQNVPNTIAVGTPYSQNFNHIGTSAFASLPSGWKMCVLAGRVTNRAYDDIALGTTTSQSSTYSTAIGTSATNGMYNFGVSSTNRAIGGLSAGSGNTINMYLKLENTGTSEISDFTISYDVLKFRNGQQNYSIKFYYSTTGAANTWIEVPGFIASFPADGNNNGTTNPPIGTVQILDKTLSQSLAAGSSIYFMWHYCVTTGSTYTNGQALGIDNIVITGNAAQPSCTSPTFGSSSSTVNSGTSATLENEGFSSLGGCTITEYGFVWDTATNPTTDNNKVPAGTSYIALNNSFDKEVSGLTCGTDYYYRAYAITLSGATVYATTSNTFKTTACPTYNITLDAGTGNVNPTSFANVTGSIMLPTATPCAGWTFSGWKAGSAQGETTTAPTLIPAGSYTPMGDINDINLYAVYEKAEIGGGTAWERVTSLSDITAGTYVILNGPFYLPNVAATNGTTSSVNQINISTKSVSVSGNYLNGTVAADMQWNFSGTNTNAMTVRSAANNYYLYTTNSNTGLRVNTTSDTWAFDTYSTGFSMRSASNGRYCAVYTAGNDWRSYDTRNASNYQTNNGSLDIYKKTEGNIIIYNSNPICFKNKITLIAEAGEIDNGINSGDELEESISGDGITLPSVDFCEESQWEFAGWTTVNDVSLITSENVYPVNTVYHPQTTDEDVLYAVFGRTIGTAGTYKFINSISSLEEGKKYLLVSTAVNDGRLMAMTSTNAAGLSNSLSAVLIASDASSLPSHLTPGASGATLFTLEKRNESTHCWAFRDGTSYVATTNTTVSNQLGMSSTLNNQWAEFSINFSSDMAIIKANKSSNNLISYYGNPDDISGSYVPRFSCYNLSSASKRVYLYKEDFATVYHFSPTCASCPNPTIVFDSNLPSTVIVGNPPFNIVATADIGGVITYSSSNPESASIDETSGEITINEPGNITITATWNKGDECEVSSSYSFTVLKGNRTYVLVTSIDDLKEDGNYLIVGRRPTGYTVSNFGEYSPGGYYALSLQQETNNRRGSYLPDVANTEAVPQRINAEKASYEYDLRPFEIKLEKNANEQWELYDAINNTYLGPFKGTNANNYNYLYAGASNRVSNPAYEISFSPTDSTATILCVNDERNTDTGGDGNGRNYIMINQGGSGSLPLFSSYLSNVGTTTARPVYIYRYVDMREFWLPESGNEFVSFAEEMWRVKFEDSYDGLKDSENWAKTGEGENDYLLVSIPQNNNRVERIKISGNATTGNNPVASYMTKTLEIDETGMLNVTSGRVHASEKAVMYSTDNKTAQLKSTNGTLSARELHVKKPFRNAAWYHVSFPFDVMDIAYIKDINSPVNLNNHTLTLNPNTNLAGRGIWASFYNGEKRARANGNPEHFSREHSMNWEMEQTGIVLSDTRGATLLKANKGYEFGQNYGFESNDTLILISQSPAPASAWTIGQQSYNVEYNHSDFYHCGWNLIGNPHTFNYDIFNSNYMTYSYDEPYNNYDVEIEKLQPFQAFFIQLFEDESEKQSVLFEHNHANMLRSRSISSPYEQIKLSITKDNLFYDYFNLRIGDYRATTIFDYNIDAHKILSSTAPQLYSKYYGIDYAINSIPNGRGSIPLAYKAPSAGNYTISFDVNKSSQNIARLLLLDKEQGNLITDLLVTPSYEFTATAQTNTTRFELLFELLGNDDNPTDITPLATTSDEIIIITTADKQLILRGLDALSTVTLYDITGKMMNTFTKVNNDQPIWLSNLMTGVYIVKIENESQTKTAKIIIK